MEHRIISHQTPAGAWDAHCERQDKLFRELGISSIDPAERLVEALSDEDGFFAADAGEYGSEAQDIGNVLAMAVERRAYGQGASDADIVTALMRAADELIRNRPVKYWEAIQIRSERYSLPSIKPALDRLSIRRAA